MGIKSKGFVVLAILLIFAVSGCETVPKKFREEVLGIKSRVDTLETKVEGVESKQSSAERATMEQSQAIEELKAKKEGIKKTNICIKPKTGRSREGIKETQRCLQAAGFYSGKIDGVKGRSTRKAIREFQKANGLRADGIVGKKTWELLSKYSGGARSAESEEGATK